MADADWSDAPNEIIPLDTYLATTTPLSAYPVIVEVISLQTLFQVDETYLSFPLTGGTIVVTLDPNMAVVEPATYIQPAIEVIELEYNSKPLAVSIMSAQSIQIVPLGGYIYGTTVNPIQYWG